MASCECGCGQSANGRFVRGHNKVTHGAHRSPAYRSWQAAKSRTTRPTDPKWPLYGGRGITMCQRYRDDFAAFLADVGERPEGTSLDRVNNDGGYSCGRCMECLHNCRPLNVRWATAAEQANNRRPRTRPPVRRCSTAGCGRPHYAKGLCLNEYMRARRAAANV